MKKERAVEFLTKKLKIEPCALEGKRGLTFGFQIETAFSKKEFDHDPANEILKHLDFLKVEFERAMEAATQWARQAGGYVIDPKEKEKNYGFGINHESSWFNKNRIAYENSKRSNLDEPDTASSDGVLESEQSGDTEPSASEQQSEPGTDSEPDSAAS